MSDNLLRGTQTLADTQTFTKPPVLPVSAVSALPVAADGAVAPVSDDANSPLYVHKSGAWIPAVPTGTFVDDKAKVSATDTTAGYLDGKIVTAGGASKAILTPGGIEQLQITAPALSSTAPVNVTKAAANAGAATESAKQDHKHDVSTAAPSTGIGAGNTEGAATSLARSDHDHKIHETGDPADLAVGAIADGAWLKRTTSSIVGAALPIDPDEKSKVSATDTTADYLNAKLVTLGSITKTILGGGSVETVRFEVPEVTESYTCYVSPAFTNNTTTRRFQTIGAAYAYAKTQVPTLTSCWTIYVGAGGYNECLTLDTPYINLVGSTVSSVVVSNSTLVQPVLSATTYLAEVRYITFVQVLVAAPIAQFSGPATSNDRLRCWECGFVGTTDPAQTIRCVGTGQVDFQQCVGVRSLDTDNMIECVTGTPNVCRLFMCYMRGVINVGSTGGLFTLDNAYIDGRVATTGTANVELFGAKIKSTGQVLTLGSTGEFKMVTCDVTSGGGANTISVTAQPSTFILTGNPIQYTGTMPSYCLSASVAVTYAGGNNWWKRGMNGNCKNSSTTLREVSASGSPYSTIADALGAASTGDTVLIDSGVYNETGLVLKSGVTIAGRTGVAASVVIQGSADIFLFTESGHTGCTLQSITVKTTVAGNRLFNILRGVSTIWNYCTFDNGYISANSRTAAMTVTANNCTFSRAALTDLSLSVADTVSTTKPRWFITNSTFSSSISIDCGNGTGTSPNIQFIGCTIQGDCTVNSRATGASVQWVRNTTTTVTLSTSGSGDVTIFRFNSNSAGTYIGTNLTLDCAFGASGA